MAKLADYLLDRLAQLGIEHVFGVPGDYAFPLNDAITARKDMRWIGCSNELNAAYAADGYARIRGVAALNTTYGVGELSAINGVAGAYAEHLPVIHLVGMPKREILQKGPMVHHTLGNGQTHAFYEAAGHVVCAQTILDGKNCVSELERVLATMHEERRPIYIGVPGDAAHDEVIIPDDRPLPRSTQETGPAEQVARRIIKALAESQQPCVLPGMVMARYGERDALAQFLHGTGLPYATMFMDKNIVGEHHPGFVGMYCGHLVQERVAAFVEQADLVLTLGTDVTDFNTGQFTQRLAPERVISVTPAGVRFGTGELHQVEMTAVMAALTRLADTLPKKATPGYLGDPLPARQKDETEDGTIRIHTLYTAIREALRPDDILVGETGTISMGMGFVRLPEQVQFEEQSLWGAIGWATPAAFGMAIAAPQRRVILLTGEGSHQLTVQAVGEFARFGCHPLILVLNNNGYLIERLLCSDGERYYNDVAQWDYTTLARGFGCTDWHCARISTPQALQQALKEASADTGKGAYLEVLAPRYEAPPLAEAMGHKAKGS